MISRLAMAGAVGATMFALAGAGAAALSNGTNESVVQQSNALTAVCKSSNIDVSNVVDKADVTYARVFQQSVEPSCGNDFIQVALKMDNGAVVYSNKVWIPTSNVTSASQLAFLINGDQTPSDYGYAVYGNDLKPQFPAGVCAADVQSTVLTVASQIDSPGTNTAGAVSGQLPLPCANTGFFQAGQPQS